MKLSQFFIGRPIFAGVLSALIFLAGLIALPRLPISEYPEVVPPTVVVKASYPGANPKVIAETVASPLEQSINGVEGMLYQSSQATADGLMTLTITFALGTDIDKAQVQVQNRVSQTLPKLPDVVQRLGVITNKASPDLTMVVHLVSPGNRYDTLYLSNYALLRVKDELARLDGVGDVQVFGAGQFSMRIWLDPEKVASRGLTADDVVSAIREQNIQVAAGQLGAPPLPSATEFQVAINVKGRLTTEDDFRNIIVKTGAAGQVTRLKDVARVELGADSYALRALLDNQAAAAIPIFQRPAATRSRSPKRARQDAGAQARLPARRRLPNRLRPHRVRAGFDPRSRAYADRGHPAGRAGGHRVPADLARLGHPVDRGAGIAGRNLCGHALVRLQLECAVAVRPGARHRHRRRRCDRGG
jgi:multidrug efflux pump subunit AcrB